jgi:hypothetical protein
LGGSDERWTLPREPDCSMLTHGDVAGRSRGGYTLRNQCGEFRRAVTVWEVMKIPRPVKILASISSKMASAMRCAVCRLLFVSASPRPFQHPPPSQ